MKLKTLRLGAGRTNCYLVRVETGPAYVIDPADDAPAILAALEELGAKEWLILLTHAHFDHILALNGLGAEAVYAQPLEEAALRDPVLNLSVAAGCAFSSGLPLVPLGEGDAIGPFSVLHTPGHSPGSLCFYCEEEGLLFSGDILFFSGIGRSDLPGGDQARLGASLRRLLALPPGTLVFPGHGPETSIGAERRLE
ncbi:MAG: MBL fold metallo-hydrolase [Christensenellaceae bacterium]|jgi:glyoxylase-like metal-dependent hydrolase (beta-lactamase superfamily II)|nr:MBL fold metallo-hydrolase [Christensenellaceae bacterium]